MSLIILEDEHGNRRSVPSGKTIDPPRRPGERIIGIDKKAKRLKQKEQYGRFILLGNLFGMGIKEFITFSAKVFGVKPCSFCEMRGLILQRMGELGFRKALWMLFQTFKEQFGKGLGFSATKKILIAARELIGGKSNGLPSD